MEESVEKPLAQELSERGMKKDSASLCQTLLVKIGTRTRKAATIDEIIGDMESLHHFKKDLLSYVQFHGRLDSGLKVLIMNGYLAFNQNTAEYAMTAKGLERVAIYLPAQR